MSEQTHLGRTAAEGARGAVVADPGAAQVGRRAVVADPKAADAGRKLERTLEQGLELERKQGQGQGQEREREQERDQEREQTRAAWDAIAAGYDELVTPTGNWALPETALRLVGLRPGMRFLDVASGSGALSVPAARLGGDVTAVDLSPAMIERLEARARAEGLSNLDGRVMDGHALELEDDAFDVAGSQFGVMLFPDLPRGLSEMARVTRPGGRVLMVVYGPPPRVEFLSFFLAAMTAVVPDFAGPPMDPPPLPFQAADPAVLRRRMEDAGLRDVRVEGREERLEFGSGQEMWAWTLNSNPIAGALTADLTEAQRDEVVRVLDGMLRERAGFATAATLTAPVNIAIGTP